MLSFDITDRNIRIIRGAENKNKIAISSAATLNIDEDIIVNGHVKDVPRLATIMNQKIKQNRMMDKEAIVSISSNMTIFKELTVRRAQKEQEFTKMVKTEMQAKVGIDDTYAISYSIVGASDEGGDMLTVLATACPTEVIDSYKRVFSMLGISLRSVIIGCNCITKVLLSDEKNRSKMPLLAVQIDGSFISLNIYENNQLSFSRFASIDAADYDNSSDYVYEAVNENIFRMLQFHRSRNAGDPIRNVVLYGDTREYMRISKDLEQMDINTTVITVPKNVKGYQNLDFALYANAIGAMFPRNKATEKINLLELG
ncbi:MAG: pilus assembly protein PilM, partial [Oscillospiraceae bacterium]|nr:pilus assembly protein PilM [Oscillospiraceae bacterium]